MQAQPWYATNSSGGSRGGIGSVGGGVDRVTGSAGVGASGTGSVAAAPDPLDVVYPVVWFPGVTDYPGATPIAVHEGETKEADFRLLPVPGFHLRVAAEPPVTVGGDQRFMRNNTSLSQVLPDGTESPIQYAVREQANGQMEFSGLAPGTYVVHQQDAGTATLRIAENSTRTLDVSQAAPGVPVVIKVDAAADMASLQISFRDVESGRLSYVQGQRESGGRGGGRRREAADALSGKSEDAPDRSISLQPGRYEVTLNGVDDLHLTGIEAKGATATGRTVTIAGGAPVLTLHVAGGRATVTGLRSIKRQADGGCDGVAGSGDAGRSFRARCNETRPEQYRRELQYRCGSAGGIYPDRHRPWMGRELERPGDFEAVPDARRAARPEQRGRAERDGRSAVTLVVCCKRIRRCKCVSLEEVRWLET